MRLSYAVELNFGSRKIASHFGNAVALSGDTALVGAFDRC